MSKRLVSCLAVLLLLLLPSLACADLFINEIDYDNAGTDNFEWIEIVGTAGDSLNNYELAFLNGASMTPSIPYATFDLAPANYTFTNETNGWGFFVIGLIESSYGVAPDFTPGTWTQDEIQNGAPDAVQLRLKSPVTNVHLIEYEGNIASIAEDQSTTLGDNNTDLRTTLYLTGTGDGFADFTFANAINAGTPGALNAGQTLQQIVPEASAFLFGGGACCAVVLGFGARRILARS